MANVLPPGNLFFDVVPWDNPYDYCYTAATSCEQLDPSKPETGGYLFQIFINPPEGYYGEPITGLFVDLYWPEEWYLSDFAFCSGGTGTLDWYGPNPHRLEISWPCTSVHEEMFLAATIVLGVWEFGVLAPEHNVQGALQIGCPPGVIREYPLFQFAEAGTRCEHEMDPCGSYAYPGCAAYFPVDVLHLAGEPGEAVHGELPFTAGYEGLGDCAPSVRADDEWAKVDLEDGAVPWEFTLGVSVDLTGMEPGTYTTNVHVASHWMERCAEVLLDVETPSGIESPVDAHASGEPLRLRVSGVNPSPEGFMLSYEIPAAALVRCAVYDASGREIATILRAEEQGRGPHTVTWDGRDARGDRVMPGVYLIRLSSNGEHGSGRVVVVR
jgi:hypothetical protein